MRFSAVAFLLPVVPLALGSTQWTANFCPWTRRITQPVCAVGEDDSGNLYESFNAASRGQKTGWIDARLCVKQYCLFANHDFAGGHGIAVISTLENLEIVKAIANRSLTSDEGVSTIAKFHAAEIKGKGLGLVSDETLHRGTRIMTRTPALIVHRAFMEQASPSDQYPLLDAAVDLLPLSTKTKFLSQMARSDGHRVADIMATNSFQMDLGGDDGHHYGNFPDVSRFNHDCRPNVAFYISDDLLHTTTAVRDIDPGEELSISYLNNFEPRALRQTRARQAWGFGCACSQCSLPERQSTKSDERLKEIARMEEQLTQIGNPEVTPALIRRFVKMHKDERLDSTLTSAYTLAALNFHLLKDDKMALKYARLAVDAGTIESGPGSEDVKAVNGLIQSLLV